MNDEAAQRVSSEGGLAGGKRPSARARGLTRAVEVLELLHAVRKPLGIGEIARQLNAPRSTIYEVVNLYLAASILEYVGSGSQVYFGRAIYFYANDYFASHRIVRMGQEEVRRLALLTGETAQFCMPIGNKYTVVCMQNSSRLFRISSDVGTRVPIPWTASGRLFVSHLSLAEMKAFVPPADFRMSDGREIDPDVFHAEAQQARRAGLFVLSGHVDEFATCLAAPIYDVAGICVATICFAISKSVPRERLEELSSLLVESGRKLSETYAGDVRMDSSTT